MAASTRQDLMIEEPRVNDNKEILSCEGNQKKRGRAFLRKPLARGGQWSTDWGFVQ